MGTSGGILTHRLRIVAMALFAVEIRIRSIPKMMSTRQNAVLGSKESHSATPMPNHRHRPRPRPRLHLQPRPPPRR